MCFPTTILSNAPAPVLFDQSLSEIQEDSSQVARRSTMLFRCLEIKILFLFSYYNYLHWRSQN